MATSSHAESTKPGKLAKLKPYAGIGVAALLVLGLFLAANYKLFRVVEQDVCGDIDEASAIAACKANIAEERFKYGSLGAEADRGVPYPIFHALPRVFADLMPNGGEGGYQAFGLPWEEGRELPVGFSKKTMGFARITQTCAVCHTATWRLKAGDQPTIVPTGPSHTTDVQAFLDFLEKAANDPRFDPDILLPEIERNFDLSLLDKLLYRFLLIPFTRDAIVEQAGQFAWMRKHGRPDWGPGRDDPMNLTKFFMIKAEDDGSTGNADFPSIWNMSLREGQSLNWAGETRDPLAVFIDSALGLGAPPGPGFMARMKELREYLRAKAPPKYPGPIDKAAAGRGEAVFREYCHDCHGWGGRYLGKVIDISEIGTDPERFNTWRQTDADETNRIARDELGVTRKDMVKDVGYASQPLDGIWLRAPYLHNGSVPNLRELLLPSAERSKVFYRGCDLYDTGNVGFITDQREKPDCPRKQFRFDTSERGNGNRGHEGTRYGTEIDEAERRDLIEYLKTL